MTKLPSGRGSGPFAYAMPLSNDPSNRSRRVATFMKLTDRYTLNLDNVLYVEREDSSINFVFAGAHGGGVVSVYAEFDELSGEARRRFLSSDRPE